MGDFLWRVDALCPCMRSVYSRVEWLRSHMTQLSVAVILISPSHSASRAYYTQAQNLLRRPSPSNIQTGYEGWWMVLWKTRSLGKFYLSLEISQNLLMGLGVSDFVSVGHIFAFLSSNDTFFVSGSDFKMPVSASRRVSDFTIRHP